MIDLRRKGKSMRKGIPLAPPVIDPQVRLTQEIELLLTIMISISLVRKDALDAVRRAVASPSNPVASDSNPLGLPLDADG